jgi:dihydrofolate synthase/folylpolyglutamate synthase
MNPSRGSSPITDYDAACRFLRQLKSRGVSLDLERMKHFVGRLGHPERKVPCIHVAGTNGKGSVSAMLEAILRSAGWRTGLYTSPHLVRLGERVQVNRIGLTNTEILNHVATLEPVVRAVATEVGPSAITTYFEFMTGLAFQHFAESRCDISVIEVGLGGRLDATNVVSPEVSVITSIDLDHCQILGNDIESIAEEKAGIIKTGRPVVIGELAPSAEGVIRAVAARVGSPVVAVRDTLIPAVSTNLEGIYQQRNAAVAALAARTLSPQWNLTQQIIESGLNQVVWPGRWHKFPIQERTVILDCSHNRQGAESLDAELRLLQQTCGRRPIIVLGVLGAERAKPLIEVVCRHAEEIHLVEPSQLRACAYEQLEQLAPSTYRGRLIRDTLKRILPAPASCAIGGPSDVVVITGSVHLAGEALSRIEPWRGSYEGDLQDF